MHSQTTRVGQVAFFEELHGKSYLPFTVNLTDILKRNSNVLACEGGIVN